MKAIILAAGRGSRMKGLTDDAPKCLVEFKGRPLLDRQIEALTQAGIADIGIVTGYRRERLSDRGLFEFHNARWDETNMVSSLEAADPWLSQDTCIVSYSDIFYDPSAVETLMRAQSDVGITYDPNWFEQWQKRFEDPLDDAETFRLSSSGELQEIGEKPESVDEVEGQYMGLLRFTPKGWDEVKTIRAQLSLQERDRMHMTGTLQRIIDAGRTPIEAVPYKGEWGELDSQEDLEALSRSP